MSPDIVARFQESKRRVETWNDLKSRLPQAQEQLNQENYQLNHTEYALAVIEQQIESLQSFSIGGLVDSLLGRKESKLAAFRENAERMKQELDAASAAITETDSTVREIEQQLSSLGDPQRGFAALLEEIEGQLSGADSEASADLKQTAAKLTFAQSQRRDFQKAVQIGKHLIERLHNMTNALGRTKSKLMMGGPLGAIGNVALNSVARHGIEGLIQRVRDGLLEFATCVRELDLSEGSELDLEIARLAEVVQGFHAQLVGNWDGKFFCDASVVRPMLDAAQAVIGHLESKLDRIQAECTELEREKVQCIERAMA